MPYIKLIPLFLDALGILTDHAIGDNAVPQHQHPLSNSGARPMVSSVFARANQLWATTGPDVNCVTVDEVHQVFVYTFDGDIKLHVDREAWDRLAQQIGVHQNHVRWVYIVLAVSWHNKPANVVSQLALIVVDVVNHTYSYFDPTSGVGDIVDLLQPTGKRVFNKYDVFCCHNCSPFLPGYKHVDQRQGGGSSSQGVVDTIKGAIVPEPNATPTDVPSGLCAVITLLVLVCCRRLDRKSVV